MSGQNNGYINPLDLPRCEYNFDFLYNYYSTELSELVYSTVVFDNLPETISETFLKYCLFSLGKSVFFKNDDKLLALNASPSNVPDVYYVPTDVIVSNRVIGSRTLTRDKNCVVVYCTSMDRYARNGFFGGLYGLISKTSTLLADNDLSINIAQKNTRLVNIMGTDDSTGKSTIDEIMRRMYAGEPYMCVQTRYTSTLQVVPVQPQSNNQHILQLIELHQYILAHFYEQIGLTTHDQIKKERLINAEVNDNTDMAAYNIHRIIKSIRDGIVAVNNMFGTDITVKLNPLLQPEEAADGEPESKPEEKPEEEAADGEPEEEPEEETADGEAEEEPEEEAADGEPESKPEEEPEEAADGEPESEPEEEPEEAADGEPESEPEEKPEEAADGEPVSELEEEQEYQAKKQVVVNVNGDNADVEVVTDAE